ncbi:FeoA family protein [Kordiimonas aquimaris]|uniref:FeoA family protein n=1 Tax=Kordiimonas aquimaris TaxID=707591 RepID=UPI0021D26EA0|nr:FeoA family protein [Kordiimonas aquimaris]
MADINEGTLLGNLKVGYHGQIKGFVGQNAAASNMIDQLREMGFSEGLDVSILHQNPFGKDPIAVKVGSMTIALRRREANLIEVMAS